MIGHDPLPQLTEDTIASALRSLKTALKARGLKDETVTKHAHRAEAVLRDMARLRPRPQPRSRPGAATHGEAGRLAPTGPGNVPRLPALVLANTPADTDTPLVPASELRHVEVAVNIPPEALVEGECVDDYSSPLIVDGEGEGDPFMRILRLRHAEAAQAREIVGAVMSSPFQLSDWNRLEAALMGCLGRDTDPGDAAVALTGYHFVPRDPLLDAEWAEDERIPGRLYLNPEAGILEYVLTPETVGWLRRDLPGGSGLYQPASEVVCAPLSHGILEMLRNLERRRPRGARKVFVTTDRQLNAQDLDAAVSRLLGRLVTAAELRRGSRRWMCAQGLERVYAAAVGSDVTFAERSTGFYANIYPIQMARCQLDAAAGLGMLGQPGRADMNPFHIVPAGAAELPPFGSRIVPRVELVRQLFRRLREILALLPRPRSLGELIRAHNVFCLYTSLAYFWAIAARPFCDGISDLDDLVQDAQGRWWARIADKSNRTHLEARVVPVSDTPAYLLEQLRHGGAKILKVAWIRHGVSHERVKPTALFFFLDQRQAVPWTPGCVRDVLRRESLEQIYPFPLNAHRHFWITDALRRGTPLDTLEPFLGHQHPAHEPAAWYAMQSLRRAAEPYDRMAATIVRVMGIEPIRYPV